MGTVTSRSSAAAQPQQQVYARFFPPLYCGGGFPGRAQAAEEAVHGQQEALPGMVGEIPGPPGRPRPLGVSAPSTAPAEPAVYAPEPVVGKEGEGQRQQFRPRRKEAGSPDSKALRPRYQRTAYHAATSAGTTSPGPQLKTEDYHLHQEQRRQQGQQGRTAPFRPSHTPAAPGRQPWAGRAGTYPLRASRPLCAVLPYSANSSLFFSILGAKSCPPGAPSPHAGPITTAVQCYSGPPPRPNRRNVFQNVSPADSQRPADGLQRGEADRLRVVVLEDGEIGQGQIHPGDQLVQAHLAAGHHHIRLTTMGIQPPP